MDSQRPAVFLGSSAEGHKIAQAIQQNLDFICECSIWNQGVFGLSSGTLESLVKKIDDFDFAILSLTPDDLTHSREDIAPSPRDNVIFELGLCIGALGRDRVFLLHERDIDLKLPSDLAGITPATYQLHSDGNLKSSLGSSCTEIQLAIEKLGCRNRSRVVTDIDLTMQFKIIHDLLDDSIEQFFILMLEQKLTLKKSSSYAPGYEYFFSKSDQSAGRGSLSTASLCKKLPDAGLLSIDLKDNLSLTDRGRNFAQWLIDNGHKAVYFTSPAGTWGDRPEDLPDFPAPFHPIVQEIFGNPATK